VPRALAGSPRLAAQAAATAPAGSDIGALEHIVFLMMENRSYDHYFGSYWQGRGFDDHPPHSLGAFAQHFPDGGKLTPPHVLLPFHLQSSTGEECTASLNHNWGAEHDCWNGGRMDSFVSFHTTQKDEGVPDGEITMGYYTRADLPFYYALADNFTLCDRYHSSILGPTHPNRLMANSGTIDPSGQAGGPITDTNATPAARWSCSWPTIQEVLQDAGISWKVYHPSTTDLPLAYAELAAFPTWQSELYDPTLNDEVLALTVNILPYFATFEDPTTVLHQRAFGPTFPGQFGQDVAAGTLPTVSWIVPPLGFNEHPAGAPDRGMYVTSMILNALMSNPAVWSKTALFLMYDENDGFFDHVPPPVAPAGTPGEELTATPSFSDETAGIRGPLGLGMRVPMLVVSPFSRGGRVVSEVFDHTSQLHLLHERFGIEVPNVSAWRRSVVGDLTATLFQGPTDTSIPTLPTAPLPAMQAVGDCNEAYQDAQEVGGDMSPMVPLVQSMPTQEPRPT